MYQENDVIVYGTQGIYRVEEIIEMKLGKQKVAKSYYVLKEVFHNENKIYAPIDIETVKIRKIISKKSAENLIESMPEIEIIDIKDEKSNQQAYQSFLASTEPENWISILKTIYRKDLIRKEKGIKQLAQSDHQFKKVTEGLLYGELSISLNMSREDVEEYIYSKIDNAEEVVH